MIVLGFDTATPLTAVGLRLADGRTLQALDDPSAGERPGHITRLLPMAEELLGQAGLPWSAIERIAVGLGPGTFTGLRIGAATARGLARSLSVELVGISTPLALAQQALADAGAEAPRLGVLAVIDARRGEAFAAAYSSVEGLPQTIVEPRALAPEQLGVVVAEAEAVEPHSGARHWVAVGDGAIRFREQLEASAPAPSITVPPDDSPLHRVSAGAICALASDVQAMAAGEIVPDYRRRPDAELALEAAER